MTRRRRGPGRLARAAPWLAAAGTTAGALALLRSFGRVWWCRCGEAFLWSGQVVSRHNSQHLLDPYTFSHVLHGLLFYAGARWLLPRRLAAWRFPLALAVEAAWEVLENTDAVIERYREATISLDYYGDSVLNSAADIAACAAGYLLARRLPWRASVAVFAIVELALALTIRDGLILNAIMLIWPQEWIRAWQTGS